jgi:uncharacterized protein
LPPRRSPSSCVSQEGTGALPSFARRVEGGIDIAIKVVPGASRSEVAGPLGGRLKLRVAAPPERGKANDAVVRLLRAWLGVRDVEIVAGRGSSEKTVRVRDSLEASGPEKRSWLDRLRSAEERTRKP